MKTLKYVLNKDTKHFAIIPDNGMTHDSMYGVERWTSAGFVGLELTADGKVSVQCGGRSVSLKLESNPEDSAIIERALNDYW